MEHLSPSQLRTLRDLFTRFARRRGGGEPTIGVPDLHRILQASGIRLTESDANALVMKADTTGSGSGLLSESDFVQIMTTALSDSDLAAEVDALYDKIAASTGPTSLTSSGSTTVVSLGALSSFLDQLRKQPGVGPTVPPFTKAELAAFFADAATGTTPAGKPALVDDGSLLSLSREDFQRLMHLQVRSSTSTTSST